MRKHKTTIVYKEENEYECNKNGLKISVPPKEFLLVLTIQHNWTTSFSSLIVDFNSNELLPNYPAEILTNYNEKRFGDLLICYKSDLPRPVYSDIPVVSTPENLPFCCPDKLTPNKQIRIEKEIAFSDFLKSSGTYPNYIFEITINCVN
ncbi:hypothetical protein PPL_04818 [Heterostelium album PN500]|uniref:Uncharacterized protein n=1 Tax=Heterostelium pallidum (strain ATCC 26659 / Pp 5 / PN500) TaxID=670386 RepID=D3B8M5_HETP5|nr:hypothetical protein PPL_04818 [Heterostelium album PN500]EFA82393.1 hypothetical protein PPL_04818 [Heterostelium album PN500]|eukprot:XP_020434510.1 hypothetical protein PPL_04818 [Heterostelium album PN500]